MKKLGIRSHVDTVTVYPDASGIVSPSEIGFRRSSFKEPTKKKRESPKENQVRPVSKRASPDVREDDGANEKGTNVIRFGDFENRDTKRINAHITVNFEDVLGEPDVVSSPDWAWLKYKSCYTCCKNFVYTCSSVLCSIPLATAYGCVFAFISFPNVWILSPCTKVCEICSNSIGRFVKHCALCCIGAPCSEFGQLFGTFNPRATKISTLGKRATRVTFSDDVKTKRIPARKPEDKMVPLTRFQIIRQVTAMRHMPMR